MGYLFTEFRGPWVNPVDRGLPSEFSEQTTRRPREPSPTQVEQSTTPRIAHHSPRPDVSTPDGVRTVQRGLRNQRRLTTFSSGSFSSARFASRAALVRISIAPSAE